MFSVVVDGQLILERCDLDAMDNDIVNQFFRFVVRDFSRFALQSYGMENARDEQRTYCKGIMLIKPQGDSAQYDRVWTKYAAPLSGEYAMNE